MIRDLRGVIEREKSDIGIFLTLIEPKKTMISEAAAAGQFEMEGFDPVPRIQIVTIEEAFNLRDRAVRLPARRDDTFKKPRARKTAPHRANPILKPGFRTTCTSANKNPPRVLYKTRGVNVQLVRNV